MTDFETRARAAARAIDDAMDRPASTEDQGGRPGKDQAEAQQHDRHQRAHPAARRSEEADDQRARDVDARHDQQQESEHCQQRGEDRKCRGLPGQRIDYRKAHAHRRIARIATQAHHAAGRLHDVVDGRPVAQRTRLSVARHRAVDESRVELLHRVVAQA